MKLRPWPWPGPVLLSTSIYTFHETRNHIRRPANNFYPGSLIAIGKGRQEKNPTDPHWFDKRCLEEQSPMFFPHSVEMSTNMVIGRMVLNRCTAALAYVCPLDFGKSGRTVGGDKPRQSQNKSNIHKLSAGLFCGMS